MIDKELTERFQGKDRSDEWWEVTLVLKDLEIIEVRYKERKVRKND